MVRKSLRKARGHKATTRKAKDQKKLNPRKVRDEALRERWDKRKTVKQNLEATNVKEMYKDRLPAEIPTQPKHIPKVNEDEAPICAALVKKHGTNYEAMHWDKANVQQWTTKVCKKKVE